MNAAESDKPATIRERLALVRLKDRLWPYRELFDKATEWAPRRAIARCELVDSEGSDYKIYELPFAIPADWQPWGGRGLPVDMPYDLHRGAIKWNTCIAAQYMLHSTLEEEFNGCGVTCKLADFYPRLRVGFRWTGHGHKYRHSALLLVDEDGFRFIWDPTLEQLGWGNDRDWLMEESRYVEKYTHDRIQIPEATASERVKECSGSDPPHFFTRDVRRLMCEFAAMSEDEKKRAHPLFLEKIEQISETARHRKSWYGTPSDG